MAEEETVETDAPEQGTQETPEQQAEREEREGQLSQGSESTEGSQEETAGEDDAAAKRQQRVQKRIDQLTKQRHEALREAEKLRAENRQLREKQSVEPPADDPRPKFDDYSSVEQYQTDIEAWARRQARRETEAAPDDSGPSVEEQEAIDRVANAAIEASARYPDFESVVYDDNLPITTEMVQAAAATESVADVLYHLGKNPEEAQRLSQLTGTPLVREIGRLEARLEASSSGTDKSSTSAPEPIQPVSGTRGKREPTDDELDIDQWMKRRQEQVQNRRQ